MTKDRYSGGYYGGREGPMEKVGRLAEEVGYGVGRIVTETVETVRNWVRPESGDYRRYSYYRGSNRNFGWWRRGVAAVVISTVIVGGVAASRNFVDPAAVEAQVVSPAPSPTPALEATRAVPTPRLAQVETRATAMATAEDEIPLGSRVEERGGVRIVFDEEGKPVSYRVGDEEEVMFDAGEVEAVIEASGESHEPGILWAIQSPSTYWSGGGNEEFSPSADKPLITEMPSDVLSEAELEERGIKIVQGETQLYIRSSAFDQGNLLDAYQPGGSEKLTFVIVDGPCVSTSYMSDPKYDPYRDVVARVDRNLENYRQGRIDFFQRALDSEREIIAEKLAKGDMAGVRETYNGVFTTKWIIFEYENMTPAELAAEAAINDVAGLYMRYGPEGPVVFVATGADERQRYTDWVVLRVNPDGVVSLESFIEVEQVMGDLTPRPGETYPSPGEFRLNPLASKDDPGSYPYGGQTAGFALTHEVMHDWMMNTHLAEYREGLRFLSEFITDMNTMARINEAHRRWVESGYKDDSLYPFVFVNPKGEIIITMNLPETLTVRGRVVIS